MSDPQDALPEGQWVWRRTLTFVVTFAAIIGLACIVWKTPEGQYLAGIAYGLIALVAWMALLYLIAPSSEHIARILSLSDITKAAMRRPPHVRADDRFDNEVPPWERE